MTDLEKKFFNDPDWKQIENMLVGYITPLIDMSTVDTKQPAEHVKAEIIGRTLAYNSIVQFLNNSRVVSRPLPVIKNPFK